MSAKKQESKKMKRRTFVEAIREYKILLIVVCMFVLLNVLVWLNKALDFSYLLLGAPQTPFNWQEATANSVIITAVAVFVAGIFIRYISKRNQAEATLRKSEEKYRTLTKSSLTGVFIHQDGKYVFVNNKFAEIHDYTPEELLGMEHWLLAHPDEREIVRQKALKRLNGETVPQRYEIRRLKKDGKTIWCNMMATSIEHRGRPAIMGNIVDITKLKHAEKETKNTLTKLQEMQDMLVQSEKLAAIGRLTAGVTHEILNPVNIISMKLQLLQRIAKLSPDEMTEIDICKVQLERIVHITKDLSHFSRIHEKQMYMDDLNNVIENVLALYAPQFKVEDIKTDVQCQPDLPMILLNKERIEQVILNIISNAVAAIKDQERKIIKIITKVEPSLKSPEYIKLIISDTGIGIKNEDLYRLFDPFFTTKNAEEGTGLGLFISYGIIQDHGGKLWAENNKSGGASFIIEFPIVKDDDN